MKENTIKIYEEKIYTIRGCKNKKMVKGVLENFLRPVDEVISLSESRKKKGWEATVHHILSTEVQEV